MSKIRKKSIQCFLCVSFHYLSRNTKYGLRIQTIHSATKKVMFSLLFVFKITKKNWTTNFGQIFRVDGLWVIFRKITS